MFEKPLQEIAISDPKFETTPLIRRTGFREYDARWQIGMQLNLVGMQALGLGLGQYLRDTIGGNPEIVIGHDYRSYSLSVKLALCNGLVSAGCRVVDIGLCLTPMAYFAQFHLDIPAVAMVTASHNPNGWTGVKMGRDRPVTFGPEDMSRLRQIVLNNEAVPASGGSYRPEANLLQAYQRYLAQGDKLSRPLRAVVACGNGTAGAFAPNVFRDLGCEVIELNCDLDHSFPNHNPNPEDMIMLNAVRSAVAESGADIGLAFDGDGDRCGIIDERGELHFSDKIGLLLARKIGREHPNSKFVVDVKSTGAFLTDRVLSETGAQVEYWKTGHSHMKRQVRDTSAIAGFEKSGHMFLAGPYGHGYDDGLAVGVLMCRLLTESGDSQLSQLMGDLPQTFNSPTMSAHCDDEKKYDVVASIVAKFEQMHRNNVLFVGQKISALNTINGVRVLLCDGSWILIRASSNAPELVVVLESPNAREQLFELFAEVRAVLDAYSEVGDFNQTLEQM